MKIVRTRGFNHTGPRRGERGLTMQQAPVKRSKGLFQGLLNEILGFGAVPLEPHRQPEQPIQVGKGCRLECCPDPVIVTPSSIGCHSAPNRFRRAALSLKRYPEPARLFHGLRQATRALQVSGPCPGHTHRFGTSARTMKQRKILARTLAGRLKSPGFCGFRDRS